MVGRVLIVDDEDTLRLTIKTRLSSAGFETETAVDGEEALEKLKGAPFDVVLLDINMPRMDGITALGVIADKYPGSDVIMLTGFADFSTAIECLKKGAKDYLVKPIDTTELITRLRSLLRARTSEAALADIRRQHSGFLAHQVLGPLTRLSILAKALASEEFGKAPKESAAAASTVADGLATMLEAVRSAVEPSHLTSAGHVREGKAVSLEKLIQNAAAGIHPFLSLAGAKLDVKGGAKGVKVDDGSHLEQAFQNLLAALTLGAVKGASISVRESGSDPVTVTLTLDKSSESGRKALLQGAGAIADTGPHLKGLSDAGVLIQVARLAVERQGGTLDVKSAQSSVIIECTLSPHH